MNLLAVPFLLLAAVSADTTTPRGLPPIADTLATLEGRVVFASDRRAVAFANVSLIGTRRGALTSENGAFSISNTPPGRYTLRVQTSGYPRDERIVELVPGSNDLGDVAVPWPVLLPTPPIEFQGPAARVDLVATLRPTARHFRVGDPASFVARIFNQGDIGVVLVSSVDASDAWASPRVRVEIVGPDSGFVVPRAARCGNNNGVTPKDFWRLEPGEELDPWVNGWIDSKLGRGRFRRPGRYTATLHYDTTSREARRWVGNDCGNCRVPADLLELLEQVPAVHLTATTEFEVLP